MELPQVSCYNKYWEGVDQTMPHDKNHWLRYIAFAGWQCVYCRMRNYDLDRNYCESVTIIGKA